MKTCECGGFLYRHGKAVTKEIHEGLRYRCKQCGKTITVRANKVSELRGRPRVADWRTQ